LNYIWRELAVMPILSGIILLIVGIAALGYRHQRMCLPILLTSFAGAV
jgi:hypothetical protein